VPGFGTAVDTFEGMAMSAIRETDEIPDDLPGSLAEPCPRCLEPLDLHQPDPRLNDRLLGVCPDCEDWYDVDGGGRIRGKLRSIGLRKS
jgi:hypothetical protein